MGEKEAEVSELERDLPDHGCSEDERESQTKESLLQEARKPISPQASRKEGSLLTLGVQPSDSHVGLLTTTRIRY